MQNDFEYNLESAYTKNKGADRSIYMCTTSIYFVWFSIAALMDIVIQN